MQNKIKIFCTGGTIDKVYFDALSEFGNWQSADLQFFKRQMHYKPKSSPFSRKTHLKYQRVTVTR